MMKPSTQIQYDIVEGGVLLTAIHRTDRGSKYRGRSIAVSRANLDKAAFQSALLVQMEKLLQGAE